MCTWTSMSAAVLAMSAGAALANDVTFTGNDDGTTWNQSANWDNGVPTDEDRAIIGDSQNAYSVVIDDNDYTVDSIFIHAKRFWFRSIQLLAT